MYGKPPSWWNKSRQEQEIEEGFIQAIAFVERMKAKRTAAAAAQEATNGRG